MLFNCNYGESKFNKRNNKKSHISFWMVDFNLYNTSTYMFRGRNYSVFWFPSKIGCEFVRWTALNLEWRTIKFNYYDICYIDMLCDIVDCWCLLCIMAWWLKSTLINSNKNNGFWANEITLIRYWLESNRSFRILYQCSYLLPQYWNLDPR